MKAGLYIHIPFCMKRCGYCAFATFANADESAHQRYVNALLTEMREWEGKISVRTVFFGGGTPSFLSERLLSRITEAVHTFFDVEPGSEWTLETHPATVAGRPERLAAFRRMGFNRLSFGVESFKAETLRSLQRDYAAEDMPALMEGARKAGFSNINLDLILGWPWGDDGVRGRGGERERVSEELKENLKIAVDLNPEHISLYPLSIEDGTPFQVQGVKTDSDRQAEEFLYAHEFLSGRGWEHYEIANYAKLGMRSRHNLIYWNYEDYLGLGLGAASKIGNHISTKAKSMEQYCAALEAGQSAPLSEDRKMSPDEIRRLSLIMRLRLKEGVPEPELEAFSPSAAREFKETGRLIHENGRAVLAPSGWLISNQLFSSIL